MAYYTKVRIKKNTILYFDSFEKIHTFTDLFFKSNKNNDYFEIALSDSEEFKKNVGE